MFRYGTIARTDWLQLPEIDEASRFDTVFLYHSLQTNNPHFHFGVHALHCGPLHWWSCVSEVFWPDNQWIKKCSGTRWTWTAHQGSKIACFSAVKFETFANIYTQLQTDHFAKNITLSNVRTWGRVIFEESHIDVLYRKLWYYQNMFSMYIQTTSGSVR